MLGKYRKVVGVAVVSLVVVALAPLAAQATSGQGAPSGHGGTGPTGTTGGLKSSSPTATPTALILDDSVSGGTGSLEAQQAVADGFVVTDVTGAQWDAMTTAQFRSYQVLIIGDPTCAFSNSFQAAVDDASTWQGAVMASGGNRVLIGTDPTYHHFANPGATTLEKEGIAYAGANAGVTGAYVDLTCAYSGNPAMTPVDWIDGLSAISSAKFTVTGVPCEGNIAIVAQSGPTATLQDTDLSAWSCSVHEAFDTYPADFFPLAIATDSGEATYSAKDVGSGITPPPEVTGTPYIMVAGTGLSISSNIALTPATDSAFAPGSHTVTATVTQGSPPAPVAGTTVTIQVVSGPNTGRTGSANTNSAGQTTFTYTDTGGVGTDQILGSFTDSVGAVEKALATMTWKAPDVTKITATPVIAKVPPATIYLPNLTARLTDVTTGGTPLAGQTLKFSTVGLGTLLGATICTVKTNANGVAVCGGLTTGEVAAVLGLGYNVSFAGAPGLLKSSTHAPVIVVGSISLL